MKYLQALFLLSVLLVPLTLTAGNATAARTIPFKGTYTGTVTEKVDGQTVTGIANGNGTGTLVLKSKLSGTVTGTTADPPCSPLSGPGVIAGAAGKLKITVLPTSSRGCAASEEDQSNISVSGTAKVSGGTLKFRKARGTLRFTGHYDRSTGAFDVKLTGSLTY